MPYVGFEEFVSRLKHIKNLGYVKSLRSGNTGIGKTLETLLDIEENNNSEPDIAGLELKSHRANSTSLITISTKEPNEANRRYWGDSLARKYGYENSSGKKSVRTTLKPDEPSEKTGLYLSLDDFEDGKLRICHEDDGVIATYLRDEVMNWVQKARKGLVLVEADVLEAGETEYFWYESATRYYGWDKEAFERLLRTGKVRVDVRTRVGKNNGTAIRVRNGAVLDELYENAEELLRDVTVASPSPVDPPYELGWKTVEDSTDADSYLEQQKTLSEFV